MSGFSYLRPLLPAIAMVLSGCAAKTGGGESADTLGADAQLRIEHQRETYRFGQKLQRLRVVNHYGDLRIRGVDDNLVGVSAVIQHIGQTERKQQFIVKQDPVSLDLVVRLADDPPDAVIDPTHGRVDLIVFSPRYVDLDLETQSGTLTVKRFQSSVRARTGSGTLQVSTTGRMQLESASGAIAARQLDTLFKDNSWIRSSTGKIEIGVPTQGDYQLQIHAGGGIELSQAWKQGEIDAPAVSAQNFTFVRGTGRPSIRVQSENLVRVAPVIILPP